MSAASTRLLQVEDLCVSYGLGNVVTHVSFEMDAGQTLAVLGPNGAGKTSLGRAIAGLVKPATGAVRYESAPLTGTSVHEISRIGICYLPEVRGIFPSLSVRDNLRMFARGKPRTERNAGIEDLDGLVLRMFPVVVAEVGRCRSRVFRDVRVGGAGVHCILLHVTWCAGDGRVAVYAAAASSGNVASANH